MNLLKKISVLLIATLVAGSALAMTKAGVTFRETLKYNKKKLVLNGLGVREATIFNVDVYVAGIYLARKTKDPSRIINSKGPKVLKMQFVREVSQDKISGAWDDSLKGKVSEKNLTKLKEAMPNFKVGDEMMFTFNKNKVSVYMNKKKKAVMKGRDFSKALLAVWFGETPPNQSLKDGMLGI